MSGLPYRLGVGIMLLNDKNQVFVGRRIDTKSEAWQMPQGGIDKGEFPEDAAYRELYEETGVADALILAESKDWYYYDLPARLIPNLWDGQYQGQKQKWYMMRLSVSEAVINIHQAEPEFSEWKWTEYDTLPSLIVPFKKTLYQALIDEFRDHL